MRRKLIGALLSLSLAVSAVSFVGSSVPAQAAGQNDAAPAATEETLATYGKTKGVNAFYRGFAPYSYFYVNIPVSKRS